MSNREVTLLACGDVGPIHEPVHAYGALAKAALATGDIRFAQCERVYSDRGAFQVHSGGGHSRLPPHMADIFSDCGFNVVSVASNHSMDWGPDALLDTIDILRGKGIQAVGAGRDEEEARTPAIFDIGGLRVAVLAYCSVLREGYAAEKKKPGVAPLRVHMYYTPAEYQPGVPPEIVTVPDQNDLQHFVKDIERARRNADVVIVSLHWGVHYIPRLIADYQKCVAEKAFAAGADLILGHHAHAPKAIAVHRGKVCFYSLSNFIMSAPSKTPEQLAVFGKRYGVTLDPDYPHLPYGSDAKRTLVAKAVLTKKGITRVSFLPALIDKALRPEILTRGDPRFDDAVRFMDWVSEEFDHVFSIEGDEVRIAGVH